MAERAYRSLSGQQQRAPSPRSPSAPFASTSNSSSSHANTSNKSDPSSSSSSSSSAATVTRSSSMRIPSPQMSHRHSFSDTLRGFGGPPGPHSPRNSRHLSISSAAVQELLNNPPKPDAKDPAFAGRDWHTIAVGELVDERDVRFVEVDTGIEDATNLLIESNVAVLLIRSSPSDRAAVATFDYKDLNQYLLFATGSLRPDSEHLSFYQDLAKKAHAGTPIPLREAKSLGTKEPFVMLPHTAKLTKVMEAFGSGVHRLVVVKEWTNEVLGVLSQTHLVKFLWENGSSFPVIDQLYPQQIKDLGVGSSQNLISINGDRALREALLLMDMEGVSSLAVVDGNLNVVGNISIVDVKLLTKASSAPLLDNTCIHFISVILSSRGVQDGKDSFPVFHISPYSTLAHTVAKLVATKSHRMWVTTPPSPSPSAPQTPSAVFASGPPAAHFPLPPAFSSSSSAPHTPTSSHSPPTSYHQHQHYNQNQNQNQQPLSPTNNSSLASSTSSLSSSGGGLSLPGIGMAVPVGHPVSHSPSVSVSSGSLPGAHLSGRLSGVVSLTDVLNLFAKASGLHPGDLGEVRRGRRRSSSSSGVGSVGGVAGGMF